MGNNKKDSEPLLFDLLKKSVHAKAAIIDVAIHPSNLINKNGDIKC